MKQLVQESSARRRRAFEALAETLKKLMSNPAQQEPGEAARPRQPHRRKKAGARSMLGLLAMLGF